MGEIVTIGDQAIDIDAIDAVDLSTVAPVYGFERRPEGVYHFRVKDAKKEPFEVEGKDGAKVNKLTFQFELEVMSVLELTDKQLNPDDQIGAEHQERVWITKPEDIGRVVALLKESGFTGSGTLKECLDQFVGHEFLGRIKQAKNKNDPDNPYANLVIKKDAEPKPLPPMMQTAASGGATLASVKTAVAAAPAASAVAGLNFSS